MLQNCFKTLGKRYINILININHNRYVINNNWLLLCRESISADIDGYQILKVTDNMFLLLFWTSSTNDDQKLFADKMVHQGKFISTLLQFI